MSAVAGTLSRFAFGKFSGSKKRAARRYGASPGTSSNKKKRKVPNELSTVRSFDPILPLPNRGHPNVHTLILGTAPSEKSRSKRTLSEKDIFMRGGSDGPQYYGNWRNSFWDIVGTALGFRKEVVSYEQSLDALRHSGFALWDVLASCKTHGSLDSSIVECTKQANDIPGLLSENVHLTKIVTNNSSLNEFKKRYREWLKTGLYHKHPEMRIRFEAGNEGARKSLATLLSASTPDPVTKGRVVQIISLPSTSPAYSAMRPPEKEKIWHQMCFQCLTSPPTKYECVLCGALGSHWLGTFAE